MPPCYLQGGLPCIAFGEPCCARQGCIPDLPENLRVCAGVVRSRRTLRTFTLFLAGVAGATIAVGACAARPEPPRLEPSFDRPVSPVSATIAKGESAPVETRGVRAIGRCDHDGDKVRFTVAHLNDLQARYSDRIAGKSRYAYIAGYLRALREEVPETLVLDAGDDYEKGALAELRSMGESTRRMTHALPIDVRTLGNHDFSYGAESVLRDVLTSPHPVLATNVGGADAPFERFVRVDVGCVKVGVVGLVTQNYGSDDEQIPDAFDGAFAHDDRYVRVLEREVRLHRGEVDVMIAVNHVGYLQDVALAGAVPGVDLYVGGHSEDLLKNPRPFGRKDGGRAYVLQAGHYGEWVGRADFVWNRRERMLTLDKHELVAVDASLPAADDVAELARQVERDAVADAHVPVAFVREGIEQGPAMVELVRRAVEDRWGADALVLGADQFWAPLRPGPVTLQQLYDAVLVQRQPAGTSGFSSLYLVELDGARLEELRAKLTSPRYPSMFPKVIVPSRTYRLAIEKRAMEHPAVAFAGGYRPPTGRYAGELIDVLESYARARAAKRLPLD